MKGNPRMIAGKWKLGKSQVRFAKLIERIEKDDEGGEIEEDEDDETVAAAG